MDDLDQEWRRKGATLSDKTARDEFGLTQDEIVGAIGAGHLHYRMSSAHGNPWLRLLRREVEDLVRNSHDVQHLEALKAKSELARVNGELKRLRAQVSALEERQATLIADLSR